MSKTQMVLLALALVVSVSVGTGAALAAAVLAMGRQSAVPQQQHRPPRLRSHTLGDNAVRSMLIAPGCWRFLS
jgi:hypothetical protein